MNRLFSTLLPLAVSGIFAHSAFAADPQTSFKFSFGANKSLPGYTAIKPADKYVKGSPTPWGFDTGGATVTEAARTGVDPLTAGFVTNEKPFYFSVAVPEGNYKVTVTAGDTGDTATDLTVKAELRRVMVEHLHLDAGKTDKVSFIVNVRTPVYPGGQVSLKKPRETTDEAWAWDEKLTLEFNNTHPNLCALEIEKVDVPTIYLVGDSTMCDQSHEPWNSWGQMFTRFWKDDIAIANHAESGETVASSLGAHRFDKVWSIMKKGDYLFFAFGHNDMKQPNIPQYQNNYRRVIEQTRAKGGIPVIVSSMERKNGINNSTLAGYPEAAQQVAQETKTLFIDLHAMSQQLYKGLGADQNAAFQDGTHNNNFGSYEISQVVLKGVRDNKIEDLIKHIRPDVPVFDLAKPDKAADYKIPASPNYSNVTPLGN